MAEYHLIMAMSTARQGAYYFVGQIDDLGRVWEVHPLEKELIGPFVPDRNWQFATLRTYDFYWDAAHAKALLLMAIAAEDELKHRLVSYS